MRIQPLIIEQLGVFSKTVPGFSFGELLYSILRHKNLKCRTGKESIAWLKDIEDNDFYTAVERAIKFDQNED